MNWLLTAGICALAWFALLKSSDKIWAATPHDRPPTPLQLTAMSICHRIALAAAVAGLAAAVAAIVGLGWRAWAPWLLLVVQLPGIAFSWFAICAEGGL